MLSEATRKILFVAQIRRVIDSFFSDEDIHNSNYFDVMDKIILPAEDGNYSEYDAVATVTSKQAEFMQSILDNNVVKIAYICI